MKRKSTPLLCALLTVLIALVPLAGCAGIAVSPSPSPQASPSLSSAAPTEAPTASDTPAPSPSPSPSPSGTEAVPSDTGSASPTPSVSPPPSPTASAPAQTAAPAFHDGDRPDVTVLQYYPGDIPDALTVNLQYTKYPASVDYFVVLKSSAVKELPDANAKTLKKVSYSARLPMTAKVSGTDGKSVWYRVRISGSPSIGYIAASAGSPRQFQLQKALDEVLRLQQVADQPGTVRISDYNNKPHGKIVMSPKLPGGKTVDPYGISRDQAAPAYLTPDTSSSFRYIPDGTLCQSLGVSGSFTMVYVPYWDEVRYVPTTYIETKQVDTGTYDVIKSLTQAVVVDRTNQNIMVFEIENGQWTLISMCFVSTGKKGGYYQLTPLGDYFTEKRPAGSKGIGEFWYFPDGVSEDDPNAQFEGYAPYAIRFSGGAYLHGLPVGVTYDPVTDKPIFTGRTYESASFLGVQPESHMCVRNYTSHAKFMYKWVKDGSAGVIVIE